MADGSRPWRILILPLLVALVAISVGCGSDAEESSAEDVSTDSDADGDAAGPEAPASPPTVPIEELSAALAVAVESGDVCAFTEVFAVMSPDYSDDEARAETQRVVDDAFIEIARKAPPEILDATTTLAEETERAYEVLARNGDDRSDPEYTEIATSPAMSQAQIDFREWIVDNCDV